jgi:anti-sigma factor RsiW
MNDYEVLMMDALDGTITPSARAQLDAYLDQHPDARAMFEAMRGVDVALSAAPVAPAPAALTGAIMSNVRTMKIARPLKAQDIAMISGANALGTLLIWLTGAFIVVTAYTAYAPAGLKQIIGAMAQSAVSVLNVFSKAAQTLLAQPITWVALALCAVIVTSWVGVLSRLMRPARQHA